MNIRNASFPVAVLAATLAASSFHSLLAQDSPPREGGFGAVPGQGGPRDDGPPREAVPRPEGGPRPGGQPQNPERILAPYVEMIPDLSEAQKTHILAILEAVNLEAAAIRANTSLSPERQRNAGRALRAGVPNRIVSALTEEQLGPYLALIEERAQAVEDMNKLTTARPDEDIEQMRQRVLAGYEDVLEELSVKQKTAIIKILEEAGEASSAVEADTSKTSAQKTAALLAIHNGIDAKISPLLDKEQLQTWKKAHTAKRPK
jgi:hypothetical protein